VIEDKKRAMATIVLVEQALAAERSKRHQAYKVNCDDREGG
jgi:hypothetical protein